MEQRPRTRKSQIAHDREYKKEILGPIYAFLAISVGGTLAVAILAYFFEIGDVSVAADISMIWLTLVLIVVGAILIAALIMAIGGMSELLTKVDHYAGITQAYYERGNEAVRKVNREISKPLRKVAGLLEKFRGE